MIDLDPIGWLLLAAFVVLVALGALCFVYAIALLWR